MGGSLEIKVCGMREPENLEEVCRLEPDYLGFIFFRGSKRFVGADPDPSLFAIPGHGIKKVGVFVNEDEGIVKQIYENCRLEMVQLHGDETPEYCRQISDAGIPVIKAIHPEGPGIKKIMEPYLAVVKLFLFDTYAEGYGGTGKKFDWGVLEEYSGDPSFLLGGGIGPADAKAIRRLANRGMKGVDVNSRFERYPGNKDEVLLKAFIGSIRK